MELAVQFAIALDRRQPHRPRPIGEHHHVRAEPRRRLDRILARRDRVDAAVETVFRPRPDLDARLLVVFAVALHHAGAQRAHDHRRRLVEALARFVHRAAERRELAPRQAAAETKPQPPLAQMIEHRRLFGDAQRIVPRQDHRRRAEIDVRAHAGQIRHELQVVGAERVVEEVVLGRPQHVEPEVRRQPRQAQFLVPNLVVADVLPAIRGEDHHHADIHRCLLARYRQVPCHAIR